MCLPPPPQLSLIHLTTTHAHTPRLTVQSPLQRRECDAKSQQDWSDLEETMEGAEPRLSYFPPHVVSGLLVSAAVSPRLRVFFNYIINLMYKSQTISETSVIQTFRAFCFFKSAVPHRVRTGTVIYHQTSCHFYTVSSVTTLYYGAKKNTPVIRLSYKWMMMSSVTTPGTTLCHLF